MHITFIALGSLGDVLPYIALGKGLHQAGHEIRFATFENFQDVVTERGLEYFPIHGDSRELINKAGASATSLARTFGSLANSYARDLSAPKLLNTDLILNQLPVGLYGYDLAEKARIPMIQIAVIPLSRTSEIPFMAFPQAPHPGYNHLTHRLAEQAAWQMMRRAVNRWRRDTLGLPRHPILGYFDCLGTPQVPMIYGFSPHVISRPSDWGEGIFISGYWFPQSPNWQPPAQLEEFIAKGKPPILISFGSMPISQIRKTTETIIEALAQSERRAILNLGWSDLAEIDLPPFIYPVSYVPYDWLLSQMAMVIHHGGSGTTAYGLRSGVPSMAIPFVFDQYFWGQRIAALGAGPSPIPFRHLDSRELAQAIDLATSNDQMQQRAYSLGQKLQLEDGIAEAIDIINKHLT